MARLAAVAAVIILAAGCTSAASHAPAATSSDRASSARFEEAGLTFSYPAVWQAATWNDDVSDSSWVIVALSTTAQQDPCDSSVNIGATRITKTCGEPVSALPPGRMLVMWTEQGFSHWRQPATTGRVPARPGPVGRRSADSGHARLSAGIQGLVDARPTADPRPNRHDRG